MLELMQHRLMLRPLQLKANYNLSMGYNPKVGNTMSQKMLRGQFLRIAGSNKRHSLALTFSLESKAY